MTRAVDLPVIGEHAHFYGYITGIGVERSPEPDSGSAPRRLYATFEYNGETSVWLVPDHKLFEQLAQYLVDMAVIAR